jgi:hypothetical protein
MASKRPRTDAKAEAEVPREDEDAYGVETEEAPAEDLGEVVEELEDDMDAAVGGKRKSPAKAPLQDTRPGGPLAAHPLAAVDRALFDGLQPLLPPPTSI